MFLMIWNQVVHLCEEPPRSDAGSSQCICSCRPGSICPIAASLGQLAGLSTVKCLFPFEKRDFVGSKAFWDDVNISFFFKLYVIVDSCFPVLFHELGSVIFIIYCDAQIAPDLVSGGPSRLASVFLGHFPIILWAFPHRVTLFQTRLILTLPNLELTLCPKSLGSFSGEWYLEPVMGTRWAPCYWDFTAATPFWR